MPTLRAASVKTLVPLLTHEYGDDAEKMAKQIRKIWKDKDKTRVERREEINGIFRGHGVEFLGVCKRTGNEVNYCNAGDSYAATIYFIGPNLMVGDWANLVERNQIREVQM